LIGGHHGAGLRGPRAGSEPTALDPSPGVLDLLAVERLLAEAHLEAIVLGRIVAPRHLDAAPAAPVEEREVHERRRAGAQGDDREPTGDQPLAEGGGVAIRGETAVPAHAHPSLAGLEGQRAEGEAERTGEGGIEIMLRDAPNVVLPEDGRVQSSTST